MDRGNGHIDEQRPAFVWKDFSRFVEINPVRSGWLVMWGRYEDQGTRRIVIGTRLYPDLNGARRRLGDAVLALARTPLLVEEALGLFDRALLAGRFHRRPNADA